MMVLPEADRHFQFCAKTGLYQHKTLYRALEYTSGRRHAIDTGAHVGFWSRLLGHEFDKVTAFEPQADNFACLLQNVPDNVKCANIACGDHKYKTRMKNPAPENSGAWELAGDDESLNAAQVTVRPLDEYGFADVDFIKIDVQGSEKAVINGALQTLGRCKPLLVIEVVYNGKVDQDLLDFLDAHDAVIMAKMGKDAIVQWT